MQLTEEAITFSYTGSLAPARDDWDSQTELQNTHLLQAESTIDAIREKITQIRSQIAAERDLQNPPPKLQPLESGFIDLPTRLLEQHRRKGEKSELGRVLSIAGRLREDVGRIIVLGAGSSSHGARVLFEALCHSFHNELPEKLRLGKPRIYFEGDGFDSDSLQDLLELLEHECVDPELPAERWGSVVISKSGNTLETSAAYRVFRGEAVRYYGSSPERWRPFMIPITGPSGNLRQLCHADGFPDDEVLTIPENVSGRFAVFTAAGLVPAALVGLDVRALLLGASQMTKRFIEEPFDRNPVLQYAAINHQINTLGNKPVRVLGLWSKKLQALGRWHDQLVAGSLGKQGRGLMPSCLVLPRDLHTHAQLLREGPRDKIINNVVIGTPHHPGMPLGMADRNEDDLNSLARKTYPDLLESSLEESNQHYHDTGRPTTTIHLPVLSEHTLGQLMQMMMLATVVEARLLGVNPYGQPGLDAFKRRLHQTLQEEAALMASSQNGFSRTTSGPAMRV